MSQFCPQCGTQNITEAKFCKSCGFNLAEAIEHLKAEKNKTDRVKAELAKQQEQEAEEKRREESAKQLNKEFYSNKESAYSAPSDRDNGFKGLMTIIISVIVIILVFRSCSTDYDHYKAPVSETNGKSFTDITPKVPEKVTETEGKDVEYFNKSVPLRDNKNGGYKKPEKAIEYLTKAININSNESVYFNDRGSAYFQLKKYTKALNDYDKYIKLLPNDALGYTNRGYCYWWLDKISKAKADAKKACQLGQCQLKKDLAESEKNNQQQTSDNNTVDIERYSEGQCESMYASDTEEYKQCIKNSY